QLEHHERETYLCAIYRQDSKLGFHGRSYSDDLVEDFRAVGRGLEPQDHGQQPENLLQDHQSNFSRESLSQYKLQVSRLRPTSRKSSIDHQRYFYFRNYLFGDRFISQPRLLYVLLNGTVP
ncbi:hypothetical protein L9F63_005627, partial [Diploptera punctata]